MENKLFKIIEPSEKLRISIINRIEKEETKTAIYKIAFSSFASLTSISIAIMAIINISKDFYQSGLYEYFSLLFSDGSLIASYWQTYVMSIVESLPILPITIVVASTWVFVWSISKMLLDYKNTKIFAYKNN